MNTIQSLSLKWLIQFLIALLITLALSLPSAPSAVAQEQEQGRNTALIDIPGVNWVGEPRASDWGTRLSPNRLTIYIRHQGPGWDKWAKPAEPDAIVVMLPDGWMGEAADRLLFPVISQAILGEKDVQFIIDKNISLSRHLSPLPQSQEDKWAASVTNYITDHLPDSFFTILAEHSRGTVTNDYIKDFGAFDYVIIASPRGDQSLDIIDKIAGDLPIDIITGLSDAPSWRWLQRLEALVDERPNLRIIQLQDLADPGITHGRLQNTGFEGIWKVISSQGSEFVEGTLNEILRPPALGENRPLPKAAQPTGGVDFSSVELRYFTEYDDRLIGAAFRAVPSTTSQGVDFPHAGELAWDSLFVWLALPPDTFWVNLNPNEPDRIIDRELGQTDAGRIMLEADFQMKKTVAHLLHPDGELGQAFWDELYGYIQTQGLDRLCFSFRQWVVPGNVTVWTTSDSIYIVDAALDVKLESEYLELKGEDGGAPAGCPPEANPALQEHAEDLYRRTILPELTTQVNIAPEYGELRSIFHSRIVAEWYEGQRAAGRQGAFAGLIGLGDADAWRSDVSWDAREIFDHYVESVVNGEFNLSRQTRAAGYVYTRTYFYGGVDFAEVPMTAIPYDELLSQRPAVGKQVFDALFTPTGHWDANEVWLGGLYNPAMMSVPVRPALWVLLDKLDRPWDLVLAISLMLFEWLRRRHPGAMKRRRLA